jgi:hypothetical protein
MSRLPRKLKKQIRNAKIIYDVSARPEEMFMEDLMHCFDQFGVILYDSNKGEAPKVIIMGKNKGIRVEQVKETAGPLDKTFAEYLESIKPR